MFDRLLALLVTLSLVAAALVWVPFLHLCRRCGRHLSRKMLPMLLLLMAVGVASRTAAQGPVTPSTPFAFPVTAVGSTAATHVVTFTFGSTGTLASTPYSVLTKGAPNLDFRAAGTQAANACVSAHTYNTGDTCSVTASFSPASAGLRLGAVQLFGASGPLATVLLSGTGTAPQITFPSPAAITSLGSGFSGFGAVQGQGPFGVAVDGAGDVYATVPSVPAVYKIVAVNGTVSASSAIVPVGSGFSFPYGIAVDGAGDVFVADNNTRQLMEIVANNGTVSATSTVVPVGSGFDVPSGVVVDGAGNVFVADYGSQGAYEIVAVNGVVSASSTVVKLASIGNYPVGIALDASENLYVGAQDGTIHEIAAVAGVLSPASPLTLISSGIFDTVRGLAVDPAGDLYAVDYNNHALKEIVATNGSVSSSSPIVSIGSGYGLPRGVAIDGLGDLFVADEYKQVIFKLDMVDPPSFSYATTNVGATSSDSPKTSTVANIGNAPLLFSIPATGTNPKTSASFTLSSTGSTACPLVGTSSFTTGSLAPSGTCTLPISFVPLRGGSITGTTTLTDNNLNLMNASQSIALSGTGAGGSLSISPTSLTFGPTAQGSTSAAQTATITNTTSQAIYLSSGSLTDATDFTQKDNCNGLIAANTGTCTVSFTFTPQSTGPLSSTYSIHDLNNPNSPLTVTLSGNAISAGVGAITLSPSAVTFTTTPGVMAASQNVTLTNTGTATAYLNTSPISITGTNANVFQGSGGTCGYTLSVGLSCNAVASFLSTMTGTYTATYTVTYGPTSATTATMSVPLTGTVSGAAQASLTPTSFNYGNVTTGSSATAQTFTLTNAGSSSLAITSVSLTGTSPTSFNILSNGCVSSLGAGGSCNISVSFTPSAATMQTASLTVVDAVGTQTSSLSGTGVAPTSPADFTLTATPAAQSSYLGASVTYQLTLAPVSAANPYTSAINLSASGLPSGATASFAPASVTPGAAAVGSVMTVTIPALQGSNRDAPLGGHGRSPVIFSATLLMALLLGGNRRLRSRLSARMLLMLLLLAGLSATFTGCSSSTGFAVPQSTSTITITGTSGTLVHTTTVTLTLK